MNDNDIVSPSTEPNESASVGQIFTAARLQQGLTEQQVADRLHLRISSIQAIESDGIEKGVSLTFTKGYVRLYARLLGINPEPLLLAFDKLHAQDTQPAKLQSFSKRVAREANDSRWNMVTYIIVFAVIGLVVVWWVDQSHFNFTDSFNSSLQSPDEQTTEVSPQSTTLSSETNDFPDDTGFADELDDATSNDMFSANTPEDEVTAELNADALLPTNALEPPTSESALDLSTAIESSANEMSTDIGSGIETIDESTRLDDQILASESLMDGFTSELPYRVNSDGTVNMVFTFSDNCWVSVKDAFDETIAIGVKVKGRVMEVSGIPPIRVVLGAPQNVAIDFGGQEVDMSRFGSGSSANFQLPMQDE